MQDTWFSFVFALVVSVALLYLPGLFLGRLLNVRKFLGVAVAPVLSIACVAFLGIVFGSLGIKWSVYKLVFAVLVLGGLVFLGKNISYYVWNSCFNKKRQRLAKNRGFKTSDKDKNFVSLKNQLENRCVEVSKNARLATKNDLSNITGLTDVTNENKVSKTRDLISWNEIRFPLVLALFSGIVTFVRSMGALQIPNAISQSPDGHYHYNNVANMLETGDVSSLHMLELPPNEGFYPAAWHDFVTTVIHVTGVQIPTAANAFTYFILCFVWPISMLAFATCISRNKVFLCLVAVFVNCYSYFPLFYLSGGILYANIVAASILPMILCVIVAFLFRLEYFSFTQSVVLGLFSLVALVFSQPNAVFVVYYFVLIILPFAGWFLGKDFDRKVLGNGSLVVSKNSGANDLKGDGEVTSKAKLKFVEYKWRFVFSLLGVLLACVIAGFVFFLSCKVSSLHTARFTPDILIPPRYGRFEAIVAFLTGAINFSRDGDFTVYYINFPIHVLFLFGLVVTIFRRKFVWLVVLQLWFAFVSFVAGSWPEPYFRAFISGVFYGEPSRLLPVHGIFVVIFTVLGIQFIFEKLGLLVRDSEGVSVGFKKIGVLAVIVLFMGYQFSNSHARQFSVFTYSFTMPETNVENNYYFSKAEFDFMEKSGEKIQPGYTVAGNPFSGGTASWFMFGQKNVFYHRVAAHKQDILLIRDRLNKAGEDPQICEAVRKNNLRYVYEFSGQCAYKDVCETTFDGLKDLENSGVGKLVDQDKHGNKLFEVTVCWK